MAASLAIRNERRVRELVHKENRNRLIKVVKEEPGLCSSQYAELVNKRPSDINKILRKLAYDGIVYSMPQTSGKHSWHLNALDHKDRRTKLLCRPWDINVLN